LTAACIGRGVLKDGVLELGIKGLVAGDEPLVFKDGLRLDSLGGLRWAGSTMGVFFLMASLSSLVSFLSVASSLFVSLWNSRLILSIYLVLSLICSCLIAEYIWGSFLALWAWGALIPFCIYYYCLTICYTVNSIVHINAWIYSCELNRLISRNGNISAKSIQIKI
jgi:Zn-dependent protease with chaperone function